MPRNDTGTVGTGRKVWRLVPSSLLGRILLLTLLAMGVAQVVLSVIWVGTFRAQQVEGLVNTTRNLASSAAVLDQLRDMGGPDSLSP